MPVESFIDLKSLVQGDVSFHMRKLSSDASKVNFEITCFSEKWNSFDVEFKYRTLAGEAWQSDAVIFESTSKYIEGSRLLGLTASRIGDVHYFTWKYSDNFVLQSEDPEISVSVLPRVRVYSLAHNMTSISTNYGSRFSDLEHLRRVKCIGMDQKGRFMCASSSLFFILEKINDTVPLYQTSFGLSNPSHAFQINNGRYIVVDKTFSTVRSYSEDLSTSFNLYIGSSIVFADYSEENETMLITRTSEIIESRWAVAGSGPVLWSSSVALSLASSAMYKQGDASKIIIADTGNNRVVLLDKNSGSSTIIDGYKIGDEMASVGSGIFNAPVRAYWYADGTIAVVEKEGISGEPVFGLQSSSSSSSSN